MMPFSTISSHCGHVLFGLQDESGEAGLSRFHRGMTVSIAKLFFSLDGRIRRRDYWLYSILLVVGAFAVDFMAFRTWGHGTNYFKGLKLAETEPLGPFLLTVYVVNVLIVALRFPLSAKRWHDRNRTAWIAALLSGYSLLLQAVAIGLHVTDKGHQWCAGRLRGDYVTGYQLLK